MQHLYFVNSDGWALTCKHVANIIVTAGEFAKRKNAFENELAAMRGKKKEKQSIKELEKKFQLSRKVIFEVKNRIVNCIEGTLDLELIAHPSMHSFSYFPQGYS